MQSPQRHPRKRNDRWTSAPVGVPLRAPRHPGQLLQHTILDPMGLTQTEAARVLGVSRRRLHEVIQGQRGMTPDTAIRCALAFGTDAAFWLALQAAWDNFHTWKSLRQLNRCATPSGHTTAPAPQRLLPVYWPAPAALASRFPGLQ